MTKGEKMAIFHKKNGKQQLVVTDPDKPTRKRDVKAYQLELGKIRKRIEDRNIEKQLLEADLW